MKSKIIVRFIVSCLVVTAMFMLTRQFVSYRVAASNQLSQQTKPKPPKAKSGPEVAARVKALKENNKNVRAALKVFENKGHKPKIENSSALIGSHASPNRQAAGSDSGIFQKASFVKQAQVGDDYVELIWVPTLSIDYEWQGTAIATRYDDYGNVLDQYVANIVMVMPDHNTYQWEVVYEVPFYNGVASEPIYEPGMYTDVDLGNSLSQQQLELSQQINKLNKAESSGNVHFVKAKAQRRGGWRAWARCSGAWGVGAAVGCAVGNWWNAEIAWGPCTAVGAIGGAIGCTYGTLWS